MIKEIVNMKNIEESNLFLRKLWSEFDKIESNGWVYQPDREKGSNVIFIGFSGLGKVMFTYQKKGCIYEILVDADNKKDEIKAAINRAKSINISNKYMVEMKFDNEDGNISPVNKISSKLVKISEDKSINTISYICQAYSEKDLRYLIHKKRQLIQACMTLFTGELYSNAQIEYNENYQEFIDDCSFEDTYNWEWIDNDDVPQDNEKVIIPRKCIELLEKIVKKNFYTQEIELILNACMQFYSVNRIVKDNFYNPAYYNYGINDVINAITVSCLEPLVALENKKSANKLSIIKRMRKLVLKYTDPYIANYITKEVYTNRSNIFHEGKMSTTERYCGYCWPQIDPYLKNEMLNQLPVFNLFLFDLVGFIIRNYIHDNFV